jgi:hypothetical protein
MKNAMTKDYMNLGMIARLSELRTRIADALGDHYLLKVTDAALESRDAAQGQLVLDAFRGQPEETRQRIMNGWVQPNEYPETRDLFPNQSPKDTRLVLELDAWNVEESNHLVFGDHSSDETGSHVEAYTDFRPSCDNWPVRIEILEGTKLETALTLIKAAVEKLERDWNCLIAMTPRYTEEVRDCMKHLAYLEEMDTLRADSQNAAPEDEDVPY